MRQFGWPVSVCGDSEYIEMFFVYTLHSLSAHTCLEITITFQRCAMYVRTCVHAEIFFHV